MSYPNQRRRTRFAVDRDKLEAICLPYDGRVQTDDGDGVYLVLFPNVYSAASFASDMTQPVGVEPALASELNLQQPIMSFDQQVRLRVWINSEWR